MKRRNISFLLAASMLALMVGCASETDDNLAGTIEISAYQSANQNYAAVKLDSARSDYSFSVNGESVEAVPVSTDETVVRIPVNAVGEVIVSVEKNGIAAEETLTFSEAEGAAPASDGYLYGTTPMSFADYWYGELEEVSSPGSRFDFEAPDETSISAEYLSYSDGSTKGEDIYIGVQKNTYDNDSGMYDAITRATVGYGVYRASFAHTVELTRDDKTKEIYSNEIVDDASAPTSYRVDENTTGVEGVVLADNTRLDKENSTNYTPNTQVSFDESVTAGGAGYTIKGLKSVAVKVNAETLANAAALEALSMSNSQIEAFLARAKQITYDAAMTADNVYAVKELLSNGIYGAREVNRTGEAKDPGSVWIGNGTNGSKNVAYNDGYADLTVYVYFDQYAGYTKGSIADLTEESLNSLFADSEGATTYTENKEAGDKLAAFMHYALHYQGAKLQWAGPDGAFDTADDVVCGNMLHKDSYFSFNHGNYIEVSITKDFARFEGLGNGDYRITLIADGYQDAVVEAYDLVLDYKTPGVVDEDVPALADGEDELTVEIDARDVNVTLDADVETAYLEALGNAGTYRLSYTVGEGRNAETVVLAEAASSVTVADGIYAVVFDVSATKDKLPVDDHCTITISTGVDEVSDSTVSIHYAPAD